MLNHDTLLLLLEFRGILMSVKSLLALALVLISIGAAHARPPVPPSATSDVKASLRNRA